MSHGWTGKILFIDLSMRTTRVEDTADYRNFIGGRGINQKILFHQVHRDTPALGAGNVMVLGAGPLVGTLVPAANRLAVDFKNVITGGIGSGNAGGHLAAEMKFAGYDHIVLTGAADSPLYLLISDGDVHFRDAGDLWGETTWETENRIKRREGDSGIKTLTIGPAGEKEVAFACIIGDRGRAVGYGGGGAVLGSKKVKAIAVRGTGRVTVAHPGSFRREVAAYTNDVFNKSRFADIHRRGGTLAAYLLPGESRPHAVKNMSESFWSNDKLEQVSRSAVDYYMVRRHGCFNCPAYGSAIYDVDGMTCEGFQANSWRGFASNLAIADPKEILRIHALTNLHGLEGDHTSAVIAWAIECFERGILTVHDTDGLELRWGKSDPVIALIERIVQREGFGDVLARGVHEASRIVGRGSEDLAMMSRKNALMEAGMRSHKGWALGILTSPKGGGHLRGAPAVEFQRLDPALSRDLFGIDDISDPTAYENKAELVTWYEKYKAVIDTMGICYLSSMWMDVTLYRPDDLARFYYLVTGDELSGADLLRAGERLHTLEVLFNIRHAGFDRSDSLPPVKLMTVPVNDGPFEGERLEARAWNNLLDEYYRCHGWDRDTGWPIKRCIEDLDLEEYGALLGEDGMSLPE